MSLTQSIDWFAISPAVTLAATATLALLLDLWGSPSSRRGLVVWLSLAGTLAATGLAAAVAAGGARRTFCTPQGCSYVADGFTAYLSVLFLLALVVVLLLLRPAVASGALPAGETCALTLWSVTGMVVLAASRDLLTLVLALEVVSLPAFVLVGLRRRDPRSAEAALTFFLVSIVSTAVTIFGAAQLYGVTGSLYLDRISQSLAVVRHGPAAVASLAAVGVVLVVVGFAFKVAAVPFHAWAPDTYEGAPLPVAALLSVASKAAGVAGLLLILVHGLGPYADVWGPVVAVLAVATMTIGNVAALRQTQLIRLLAWSTVAQAGYLLVPLAAAASVAGRTATGMADIERATLVYLGLYAAANAGAFACAAVLTASSPARTIAGLRGAARQRPFVSAAMALCLTALAGLPPGVAGLFAKVAVLGVAVHDHLVWLAVVVAVDTVIGLAYYLRTAAMPFLGLTEDAVVEDGTEADVVRPAVAWSLAAVAVTAGLTLVLSVDPQPLLHWAQTAASQVASAP